MAGLGGQGGSAVHGTQAMWHCHLGGRLDQLMSALVCQLTWLMPYKLRSRQAAVEGCEPTLKGFVVGCGRGVQLAGRQQAGRG